jgi:voltage-gated potassium channel
MSTGSTGDKLFICTFIFTGIALAGSYINSIAQAVFEKAHEKYMRKEHVVELEHMTSEMQTATFHFEVQKVIGINLCIILVGAAFIGFNEEWEIVDALYWACVTATTVGYGDLILKKESSRVFATLFILVAVSGYAFTLGFLCELAMDQHQLKVRQVLSKIKLDKELIEKMDLDHR